MSTDTAAPHWETVEIIPGTLARHTLWAGPVKLWEFIAHAQIGYDDAPIRWGDYLCGVDFYGRPYVRPVSDA